MACTAPRAAATPSRSVYHGTRFQIGLRGTPHLPMKPRARSSRMMKTGDDASARGRLVDSHLLRSTKVGRVRTCELVPRTLSHAERWIAEQRATWEARSDRMAAFVENLHQEDLSRAQ